MNSNIPITETRFLAYFDIMGFKDLVYRNNHQAVASIMDNLAGSIGFLRSVGEDINEDDREAGIKIIRPVMFSDSILFISEEGTVDDLTSIITVASYFLSEMFSSTIPVKGALSYGKFTANFHESQFFGRPLIDAYLLAEDMHFYGGIFHHSIDKFMAENYIEHDLPTLISREQPAPMKNGNISHNYLLWNNIHEKFNMHECISQFYNSVSGQSRKYVDNTLQVYINQTQGMQTGPRIIVSADDAPYPNESNTY
jgi:hypothetical protein